MVQDKVNRTLLVAHTITCIHTKSSAKDADTSGHHDDDSDDDMASKIGKYL